MEFICEKKYLVFPINRYAQNKAITLYKNGSPVLDLTVRLDFLQYDDLYYYDIRRFKGEKIEIACEPEIEIKIMQSDVMDDKKVLPEKHRPLFHFTAKQGWINDPNGLVYSGGKYHLFYQHNPVGSCWGNMHWGHAVSSDLVHWEEKEIALFPDETGTMYSGSAVVDKENRLGLKAGIQDTLVLFYTAAGGSSLLSQGNPYTQCMAYSTDGGETFQKYEGNPVIRHIVRQNRDPKVIYHEQSGSYVLALYLDKNQFALFSSKDLIHWVKLQDISIEGEAECPDFYPLALENGETRWVFMGASDRYLIGSFDGYRFTPQTEVRQLSFGGLCYASQSWSDSPDNRRIRIAWNRSPIPEAPFNGSMTFPCEMALCPAGEELLLCTHPVKEIEALYQNLQSYSDIGLRDRFSLPLSGRAYDLSLELENSTSEVIHISLFGTEIHLDAPQRLLLCGGTAAPLRRTENIKIRLLLDVTGIELFADGGSVYVISGNLADSMLDRLEITEETGAARIRQLDIRELASTHEKQPGI